MDRDLPLCKCLSCSQTLLPPGSSSFVNLACTLLPALHMLLLNPFPFLRSTKLLHLFVSGITCQGVLLAANWLMALFLKLHFYLFAYLCGHSVPTSMGVEIRGHFAGVGSLL